MNEIETIRDVLQRSNVMQPHRRHKIGLDALAALEAELATLRANALDLGSVPDGHTIVIWCVALNRQSGPTKTWIDGEGDTPQAVLAAAVARVNEATTGM